MSTLVIRYLEKATTHYYLAVFNRSHSRDANRLLTFYGRKPGRTWEEGLPRLGLSGEGAGTQDWDAASSEGGWRWHPVSCHSTSPLFAQQEWTVPHSTVKEKKKATGSHKFYWTMRGRDGKCWEIKWVSQGPQVNQSFISATIALIWSTSSWSEPRGINVSKKGKRRNQFPCHWSLLPINTSPAISWGNLGTTEQPSLTLL